MKNARSLFILLVFFCLGVFVTSCKKDSDDSQKTSQKDLEVNQFIWYNMASYYLWADSVPKLKSSYFNNDTNKLNSFLATYTDHSQLFSDLLYKYGTADRFSWIESDSTTLQNELQGVSKSMGYDFRLGLLSDKSSVFGVVRYVLKGSPAEKAGIKRGNLFMKVNGTQLTINNYSTLLSSSSYNLTLAYVSGNTIYTSTTTSTMTAEVIQENPVFLDSVYTVNNNKIGYLVYNGFYPDYDIALNNTFAKFKTKGVDNLVLDLRYNGGGSIQSAIYLASMIYGSYTTKTLLNYQFNSTLHDYYAKEYGSSAFVDYFANTIGTTPINSLNLSKLYVLTSSGTASASELIINGLKPYIPVYVIGDTTVGKNVGSMTITDTKRSTWAMQPIVLRLANALGKSDYSNGFVPNSTIVEDIASLPALGSLSEPLLKKAIEYITGTVTSKATAISKSAMMGIHGIAERKDLIPHAKEMYLPSKRFKNKSMLLLK